MEYLALINSFAKIVIFAGTAIRDLQSGEKTPEEVTAEWEVIVSDIDSAFANFRNAGR